MLEAKDFLILLIVFNVSMFIGYTLHLFNKKRKLKEEEIEDNIIYYISFFINGERHNSSVSGLDSHKNGDITSEELEKELKTLVKLELELIADEILWTEFNNPKNYFVTFTTADGVFRNTNVLYEKGIKSYDDVLEITDVIEKENNLAGVVVRHWIELEEPGSATIINAIENKTNNKELAG